MVKIKKLNSVLINLIVNKHGINIYDICKGEKSDIIEPFCEELAISRIKICDLYSIYERIDFHIYK